MKSKKFTLIELLIVVAIIAILAAMLLPALNKARVTARRSACLSNLGMLGAGLMLYIDSYSEWIPTQRSGWYNQLLPMVADNRKIYICPGSPVGFDPAVGFIQQITLGLNASGATANKAFYGQNGSELYHWKLTQIKRPSTLFYLTDCAPYNNSKHPASNASPGYVNWMDAQKKIHNYNCGMATGTTHYGPANWHDGTNFLFMDGHVEMMLPNKLYRLMQLDSYGDSRPVRIIPNNNKYDF